MCDVSLVFSYNSCGTPWGIAISSASQTDFRYEAVKEGEGDSNNNVVWSGRSSNGTREVSVWRMNAGRGHGSKEGKAERPRNIGELAAGKGRRRRFQKPLWPSAPP